MYEKDKWQDHIATVIGHDGVVVKVRSIYSEQGCNRSGYRYEWGGYNHYTWISRPSNLMAALDINYTEWKNLERQFSKRYDTNKEEWYEIK